MLRLAELRELVKAATMPSASPLYRDLYCLQGDGAPLVLQSIEEWQRLPHLKKETLLRFSALQRFPAPLQEAVELAGTSGTSGGAPLFTFRTVEAGLESNGSFSEQANMRRYADLARPWLCSFFLIPLRLQKYLETKGRKEKMLMLDAKNLRASAELARAAGVTNLYVFTFFIEPLGKIFTEMNYAHTITYIEMAGAHCTRALYEFIRATFPNATVVSHYGQNETEVIAMGGRITGVEPLEVFTPTPGFFFELVDPESGAALDPMPGAEGELVVSSRPNERRAFPFVRYRTGDMARVVEVSEGSSDSWSFTLLGRVELDFIKVPGGMLRADEIERVLQMMADRVTDVFSLHVGEEQSGARSRIRATLFVRTRGSVDMQLLAREIARVLHVSPLATYADGVSEGLYAPLACKEMPRQTDLKKPRRMVQETV